MVAAGLVLLLGAKWAFDSNDTLLKSVPDTHIVAEDQGLAQIVSPTPEEASEPTTQEVVTPEIKQSPVKSTQQEKTVAEKQKRIKRQS